MGTSHYSKLNQMSSVLSDILDWNDPMEYRCIISGRFNFQDHWNTNLRYELYVIKVNHEFPIFLNVNENWITSYYSSVQFFPSVPLRCQSSMNMHDYLSHKRDAWWSNVDMTSSNLLGMINQRFVDDEAIRRYKIVRKQRIKKFNPSMEAFAEVFRQVMALNHGLAGAYLPDDIKRYLLEFLF